MSKIIFYIFLCVLLVGCYNGTRNINLTVKNLSSDTLWINYYTQATYNYSCCYFNDTIDIFIVPTEADKLIEWELKDSPQFYSRDWFYNYRILINTVVNESGSAIKIDPNVAQYWKFIETEDETSYYLELNDTLF